MDTKFDSILGKLREKDAGSGPGGSVDWSDIQGKPSTFTPSAHTHTISDVTSLQTSLDGKQDIMQLSSMPTASSAYAGKIVQYIGTTGIVVSGAGTVGCNGTYTLAFGVHGTKTAVYDLGSCEVFYSTQRNSWEIHDGNQGEYSLLYYDQAGDVDYPWSGTAGGWWAYYGNDPFPTVTNLGYTNGYFYKCVENSGSYSWQAVNVQDSTTVNDSTVTIVQGSTTRGSFTTNQAGDSTITLNDGANYTFESPLVETSGTVSLGEQYLKPTEADLGDIVWKRTGQTNDSNIFSYSKTHNMLTIGENNYPGGESGKRLESIRMYSGYVEIKAYNGVNLQDWYQKVKHNGKQPNTPDGFCISDATTGDITSPNGYIGKFVRIKTSDVPSATTAYTLTEGVTTHSPSASTVYTLPTITETDRTHECILYVDMTTTTSISFVDGGGTTIIPSLAGTPAVGEKWVFLASYSFGAWHVIGYKEA